jgi:hypothetical protein
MSAHLRSTGLEQAIEDLIAALVAMRLDPIRKVIIDESDPDALRALAGLTQRLSAKIDPLFFEIACQGGLASAADPDGYETPVTDAIAGNLDAALLIAADELEEGESFSTVDYREHNTMNIRQQI